MKSTGLQAAQVAALLLSASYGIGFLFGTGQQAVSVGMAGALYGLATALGMGALALLAPALWRRGLAIWDLFGEALGGRAARAVALLSLVWMSGVLAAQLQGGVAVAGLLGLGEALSLPVVAGLVLSASLLELRLAAWLFSGCLLASAGVLLHALVAHGGLDLLPAAPHRFVDGMRRLGWAQSGVMTLAIALLVCTGADYHQFLIAARSSRAARWGCMAAALALCLLAFLPPAVALAYLARQADGAALEAAQVVPAALALAARDIGLQADRWMLGALGAAALGSGAAILRAMAQALASAVPASWRLPAVLLRALAALPAVALTLRGQGIVDTMVSVNAVYIATVGVTLLALLRGRAGDAAVELRVMAAGVLASLAVYLAAWAGLWPGHADLAILAGGLSAAALTALALRGRQRAGLGLVTGQVRPGR